MARKLSAAIKARFSQAEKIIAELDAYADGWRDGRGRPAGFCVVRDRGGLM